MKKRKEKKRTIEERLNTLEWDTKVTSYLFSAIFFSIFSNTTNTEILSSIFFILSVIVFCAFSYHFIKGEKKSK